MDELKTAGEYSTPQDGKKLLAKFKNEQRAYRKSYDAWMKRGREIVKQYRDDTGQITENGKAGWSSVRFPVVWSNIQTMQPAVYARTPKPECERRWKDKDPLGRLMAEILERVSSYQVAEQSFDSVMKPVRDDFLLPGRGVARVLYKPEIVQVVDPETGEITEDVASEIVPAKYVFWEDFGHTVCRDWSDVEELWFDVYLTKDDYIEKFGKQHLDVIKFDKLDEHAQKPQGGEDENEGKAKITELWCKKTKKVYWFAEGMTEFLKVEDDPLKLRDFFPCPRPLYANLTTESLIPFSDVAQYKNASDDLDMMLTTERNMMKALKVTGIYDKSLPDLGLILEGESNLKMYPAPNYQHIAQNGGIKGAVDFVPIDQYVKALAELRQSIELKKLFIDESSGIADIIRGQSSPSETATAQQIKGNFATLRLEDRQREVQRFSRDLIALMTEVAIEHLSDETIAQMCGIQDMEPEEQQLFPQALAALRDDKQRTYKLSIETDSTIAVDEDKEKQRRMEAVQAITGLIKDNMPIAAQAPALTPAILETLLFAFRSFSSSGRRLEFSFEQAFQQFAQEQAQAQQAQQQQPNPQQQQIEAEMQAKQAELQLKQQELQAKIEIERMKVEAEIQLQREKMMAELQMKKEEMLMKSQMAVEQVTFKQDQEVAKAQAQAQAAGLL